MRDSFLFLCNILQNMYHSINTFCAKWVIHSCILFCQMLSLFFASFFFLFFCRWFSMKTVVEISCKTSSVAKMLIKFIFWQYNHGDCQISHLCISLLSFSPIETVYSVQKIYFVLVQILMFFFTISIVELLLFVFFNCCQIPGLPCTLSVGKNCIFF